jgi:hypothetical protein
MKQTFEINALHNEVIVREGKAAEIFSPRKVELNGNIDAPAEFVNKRRGDIPVNKTNVVVDYDELSITLTISEEEHFAKVIIGKLEWFEDLKDFGINAKKSYTINELQNVLKLKRAYFRSREEHASIIKSLQDFSAKTETEFTSINDYKGNTAFSKITKCKTNLNYNFVLNIPIFKAVGANSFEVEIEFEPRDGSIVCWLVSADLAELEIKQRDELINKQLETFNDYVLIKR